MNREPWMKVSGLQIYRVKLVGGPYDGTESLCSHDTVYKGGKQYLRGSDDRYYHIPEKSGETGPPDQISGVWEEPDAPI